MCSVLNLKGKKSLNCTAGLRVTSLESAGGGLCPSPRGQLCVMPILSSRGKHGGTWSREELSEPSSHQVKVCAPTLPYPWSRPWRFKKDFEMFPFWWIPKLYKSGNTHVMNHLPWEITKSTLGHPRVQIHLSLPLDLMEADVNVLSSISTDNSECETRMIKHKHLTPFSQLKIDKTILISQGGILMSLPFWVFSTISTWWQAEEKLVQTYSPSRWINCLWVDLLRASIQFMIGKVK